MSLVRTTRCDGVTYFMIVEVADLRAVDHESDRPGLLQRQRLVQIES